jgi:hypothetical protein
VEPEEEGCNVSVFSNKYVGPSSEGATALQHKLAAVLWKSPRETKVRKMHQE